MSDEWLLLVGFLVLVGLVVFGLFALIRAGVKAGVKAGRADSEQGPPPSR